MTATSWDYQLNQSSTPLSFLREWMWHISDYLLAVATLQQNSTFKYVPSPKYDNDHVIDSFKYQVRSITTLVLHYGELILTLYLDNGKQSQALSVFCMVWLAYGDDRTSDVILGTSHDVHLSEPAAVFPINPLSSGIRRFGIKSNQGILAELALNTYDKSEHYYSGLPGGHLQNDAYHNLFPGFSAPTTCNVVPETYSPSKTSSPVDPSETKVLQYFCKYSLLSACTTLHYV